MFVFLIRNHCDDLAGRCGEVRGGRGGEGTVKTVSEFRISLRFQNKRAASLVNSPFRTKNV